MERLNNIIRTVQQDQHDLEQQGTQGTKPQRLHQAPLQPRRSIPEQTARLGQQSSYVPTPPPNKHALTPRAGNRAEQGGRYPQQRAYGQALYKSDTNRRPLYHPPTRHPSQEPQYLVDEQRVSQVDYYDPAAPQSDVQEEWEDDAEGMRYGDWESEANYDGHPYSPTEREGKFPASLTPRDTNRPPARGLLRPQPRLTRNSSNIPMQDAEPRSPLTRYFREGPLTQMPSSPPPAPQAPAQEIHHRNTQPLNPRAVAGMNQQIVQDARSTHPAQQPTRQVDIRHSTANAAPVPPPASCPLCKGAGYLRADVPYGHPNFGKPIACECKEAERAEKRRLQLRSMSNLDAFSDKSFRSFNPRVPGVQEAFRVAEAYANDPDGWLVLIGRNGCGKTHLAAAIANQHLAQGSLVLFATVPDLLDHLRATFAPTSTVVYDQLFSTMREAELLVLDDLGSEQNSPWASEKLFQLLNYRYNSRFPTVITTNNLRLQTVDERIRSRLMDRSLVIEVTMDRAQDYRPHNPRRD